MKRGDKVVATARVPGNLDDLVATYGDSILTLPLYVTDRNAVIAGFAQAHSHFGRLDVIVNNAGYGLVGPLEETSEAQFVERTYADRIAIWKQWEQVSAAAQNIAP